MILGAPLGRRFHGGFEAIEVHDGIAEALEYCQKIVAGESWSLLLWGKTGRGKTRLVTALLNELDAKWPHGRYVYWPMAELALARRWAIQHGGEDPLKRAIDATMVVIDDLGVEKPSEYALEAIEVLVDRRWRDQKPLIVTTNLVVGGEDDEFQRRYDPRIMRRFLAPDARIIPITGPNWSIKEVGEIQAVNWQTKLNERGGR